MYTTRNSDQAPLLSYYSLMTYPQKKGDLVVFFLRNSNELFIIMDRYQYKSPRK
jgi:hypothetical protein